MPYGHLMVSENLVNISWGLSSVECCYNAVQYNKILHTSLEQRGADYNQRLNLQKTHHISP